MDASKKQSPAVRPGGTLLASYVCVDTTLGSVAHQHTAILTVTALNHQVVGGAE